MVVCPGLRTCYGLKGKAKDYFEQGDIRLQVTFEFTDP